ncbi:MAG: deoxyribodipyrimidine photolyase [Myxococcales bacterium]|nr:deoxyribodipyrimidine photolyase [Myxococcales bacterium]
MIHPARIQALNRQAPTAGRYVLYWMQQSQRALDNHALEFAVRAANERRQPLVVCFALVDDYPGANLRHYVFLLQGLLETRSRLAERGIRLTVRQGRPNRVVPLLADQASLVVTDCGYLRHQRAWRQDLAQKLNRPLIQVESDVVVPVELASRKEEFGAYTLRPKIHRLLPEFLQPLTSTPVRCPSIHLELPGEELPLDPAGILSRLRVARDVPPVADCPGGTSRALELLERFAARRLNDYERLRNDPTRDATSRLSPYLHFGQISPLTIALRVRRKKLPAREAFLEELIVRRELAMNHAHFNPWYDDLAGLPAWALRTLHEHRSDPREYHYSPEDWEQARTHDPYWNAAQREMVLTGRMPGYLRMYWGKKILEWTPTPEEAFRIAVWLNDKYELDGRDPNGYAGIAWCFGKHDRAWGERAVFGKIRYMNDQGLRRKFDADGYVRQVEKIAKRFSRAAAKSGQGTGHP